MITVIDDLGNEEPLLGVEPTASIKRNTGGDYTFSFVVIKTAANEFIFDKLIDDTLVEIDGEKFVVKQINDLPLSKRVTCIHEFFECQDDQVDGYLTDAFHSIETALNHAFSTTAWEYELHGTFDNGYLKSFGEDNTIALLEMIKDAYDIEYIPVSATKTVHIYKRLGTTTDYQIRYKHNLVSIDKQIDTSAVKTAIRVRYNQREDGSYASVTTYTSPHANKYRKVKWAKTVEFDTTDEATARAYGANMINDTPDIMIKCEFVHLQSAGYDATDIELGNSFYLIDERLHENDLARIVEIETFPLNKSRSPILTLANRVKYVTDNHIKEHIKRKLLEHEAVKKGENNGGVSLTTENGMEIKAEDSKGVVLMMNATEGILIRKGTIRKFYVDTDGNVTFDGRLLITKGDGATPLLEAFLDEYGGVFKIYDTSGGLNVKIGAEAGTGSNSGGTIVTYQSGVARAYMGASTGGYGAVGVRDSSGVARVVMQGSGGGDNSEPYVGVTNGVGNPVSYLAETEGKINGQKIATEKFVNDKGFATMNSVNSVLGNLSFIYATDKIEVYHQYLKVGEISFD